MYCETRDDAIIWQGYSWDLACIMESLVCLPPCPQVALGGVSYNNKDYKFKPFHFLGEEDYSQSISSKNDRDLYCRRTYIWFSSCSCISPQFCPRDSEVVCRISLYTEQNLDSMCWCCFRKLIKNLNVVEEVCYILEPQNSLRILQL